MQEDVPSQKKEMKVFFAVVVFTIATITNGFTQESLKGRHTEKIKVGEQETKDLHINYNFKEVKNEGPYLKVRFYNKTKKNLEVDLVMGIYSNGVLLEKADIADCLKKSIFNNFFRPFHLIETTTKDKENIEIKVLNIYNKQVDECGATD